MVSVNVNPLFHSAVLLVRNIEKSKHFYNVVLGQRITLDFGRNVSFEGGLSIWEREYALTQIFQEKAQSVEVQTGTIEVYFESEELEDLYRRLSEERIDLIHAIREQTWGQRCFRLFDPDNNIVEFAESMESVVQRLNKQGFSLEEITKKSEMPLDFVRLVLKKSEVQ